MITEDWGDSNLVVSLGAVSIPLTFFSVQGDDESQIGQGGDSE